MVKKSLLIGLATLAVSGMAFAGTDGTEFEQLYTMVEGWATGYLGRSIALIFLLIGLGIGVLRGSILGAVSCIAAAMCFMIAPSVVQAIVTALI